MKNNRNFILLCTIALMQGLVFYGPIATLYRESRGIGIYQIFIIESVFMILMILLEIPWGWFADKFGYRKTLFISFLLDFISKIIFYKAHTFMGFLLERIMLSAAVSGVSGCDTALLYCSVSKEQSEKAFSIYNASSIAGFLIATLLSTFIISKSMDLAVWLTIFPYGIAVILSLFLKDATCHDKQKQGIVNVLKIMLKEKEILIFIFASAVITEVSHSITVFLNQLQYRRVGINVRYYGLILALIQAVSMLSSRTYKLTEKYGEDRVLICTFFMVAISSLLLAFFNTPVLSVLLIMLISVSSSIVLPISYHIQNKSISIKNRATCLSAYAMFMDITSSIVNLMIGKAADISLQLSFIICGGVSILALLLNIYYFRLKKIIQKR